MNKIDVFFKKSEENAKANEKLIKEHISNATKLYKEGTFKIEVAKIDCFYDNIIDCIKNGKKVLIYADYDVDGMFSCIMMLETLKNIAANCSVKQIADKENALKFISSLRYVIPNRAMGYGISSEYLSGAYNSGIDYIITCDNGTHGSVAEMITDKEYKNKIFVFDHHSSGDFSKYKYILNPNVDGKTEISTGILLYKFFEKLSDRKQLNLKMYPDLATFTAISDVATLNSHRNIIKLGLNQLNNAEYSFEKLENKILNISQELQEKLQSGKVSQNALVKKIEEIKSMTLTQEEIKKYALERRPMLSKLLFDNEKKVISIQDLQFNAIPKLNAINRMGADANFLMKALMIRNDKNYNDEKEEQINECLYSLNYLNNERKSITSSASKEALEYLQISKKENDNFHFLYMPNTNIGIAGLIASRIVEKTNSDTIVAANVNGKISFSGRGDTVKKNLEILRDYFVQENQSECKEFSFGGHEKALGGSIYDLNAFERAVVKLNKEGKFIKNKNNENIENNLKSDFTILENSVTIEDMVSLSKCLTELTDGLPYQKKVLCSVLMTEDMITNKDDTLAKAKNKDFVSMKVGMFNPLTESENQINIISRSDDAVELIKSLEKSSANNQIGVVLMELSHNCYDDNLGVFSGKILYQKSITPNEFLDTKPKEKQEVKRTRKQKI